MPPYLGAFQTPPDRSLIDFDRRSHAETAPSAPERDAARDTLRRRVPQVRIGFDPTLHTARAVASTETFLTGPAGVGKAVPRVYGRPLATDDPQAPVKAFVGEYRGLFGYGPEAIAQAHLQRDYTGPANGLRSLVWEQEVGGIPVYEGVLAAHVTREGELVAMSSGFVPNAAAAAQAGTPGGPGVAFEPPVTAALAVVIAAGALDEVVPLAGVLPIAAIPEEPERGQRFRAGHLPGEAEVKRVWLPLDAERLRLCWQVELTRPAGNERYRVLVDATTGEVWLRRCRTVYLSDATYNVYTSDSPSPFSPSHRSPSTNQPPQVPRQRVTLAALNPVASPLGWIGDGVNETRGNNVDAHLDRNADDVPDLPRPEGEPYRVFDFPLDLAETPHSYGNASAVQLFYWCNWAHDRLYELGFTEAAGNFQKDNFGRGGLGRDAVLADAQDGSGFNNANFTPTTDGTPPRIQMYLFDGPQPARDGSLDAEIVLHEYAHGLTDRLVGGGIGLSSLQAYGLGEGWSDWYALALLSEPEDDPDAPYAVGGYATLMFYGLTENYYYGIRRYPYCTDPAINPLTLKDIDPTVASVHPGVPLNPIGGFGNPAEVHNQGEVWCVALWEMRAGLIRKHGAAAGNQLALQLVTDGLKLTPANPTFVQARDAIIQADLVHTGGANFNDLWVAFAKRGLGFSAVCPSTSTTVGVHEAYDLPDALLISTRDGMTFSGPAGGPFSPDCKLYVLTNHTVQPVDWTLTTDAPWLMLSMTGGTLAPASAVTVSVCLAPEAATLPRGIHSASLLFSNVTSGFTQTRDLHLRVLGFTGLPFTDGFESGSLGPAWSVSGAGPFQTRVTSLNSPHGGRFHVTLDSWISGTYARNELTLGLDLAGYTNVVVRFWAKSFGDDENGPPPSPFVDGADFDGVAISADGIQWYEVYGLRSLKQHDAEYVVPLDAAVAALGLIYTPTFQVRFNQYDNNPIVLDGISLDDVAVSGVPARRFTLSLPAQVNEGSGPVVGQSLIQLGAAVSTDLTVHLTSSDSNRLAVPSTVILPAGTNAVAFDLRLFDNALIEGTQPVTVTVAAPDYVGTSAVIQVADSDRAELEVHLDPKATEGRPVGRLHARVKIKPKPNRDVVVGLTSSDVSEVQVPPSLVILAGHSEAEFNFTIVDDLDLDGPQKVTITAHVANWKDGSDTIQIRDNDVRALSVALPAKASEGNGVLAGAGTVAVAARQTTPVEVTLASSRPDKLQVPARVVIPAGQFSAPFELRIQDDAVIDGPQLVTVTATARRFTKGTAQMAVIDDETPLAAYQPNPPDRSVAVPVDTPLAWASGIGESVANGGFETGSFAGWKLFENGAGNLVINDGTVKPDGPDSALPPFEGKFSALIRQTGSGVHELYQDLTIPADAKSAWLSWAHRVRNHYDRFVPFAQEFRVEIRSLQNLVREVLYRTQPGDPLLGEWEEHRVDLIRYRGQTIRLAFAEADTWAYFNLHLDAVSLWLGDAAPTTYEVYFGTEPQPGPAQRLGTSTTPFWVLPKLALDTIYYWKVLTRRGAAETWGPVWQFTTRGAGPIARLEWGPIPSPQYVNQPFSASIAALDDIGNAAAGFNGPVQLRVVAGLSTRSRVVVSELDTGEDVRVEFFNASAQRLDLTGWRFAVYDGLSWPEPRSELVAPSNSWSSPGDVFVLHRYGDPPGVYPHFYSGTHLFWGNAPVHNQTAVLVRDAAGAIVDFVCAVDAYPAQITNPVVISSSEWRGLPVPYHTNSGFTYQRVGQADHNDSSDWVASTNGIGVPGPGLNGPFTNTVPMRIEPSVAAPFVQSQWSGPLVFPQMGEPVTLVAEDSAGHQAVSPPLAVMAPNDLLLTLQDQPNLPLVGNDLTYLINVTNTGPAVARSVALTNRLPQQVAFVEVISSTGACAHANGLVTCQLGDLAGGASVQVTCRVRCLVVGPCTNTATVTGLDTEAYVENNAATVVSTARLPAVTTTDAIGFEGEGTDCVFLLELTEPSRLPISVTLVTQDDSAVAGLDYVAVRTNVVFPPGTVSRSVGIPVLNDAHFEMLEVFTVQLTSPSNATVPMPPSYGILFDDDPVPRFSIRDAAVTEGTLGSRTNILFEVRLSEPSTVWTSVRFSTQDGLVLSPNPTTLPLVTNLPALGAATAFEDYLPQSGFVSFPPGVTNRTVVVTVLGDRMFEMPEVFNVTLSMPVDADLDDYAALGIILDDDEGEVTRYEVSPAAAPHYAGVPFSLTVTATDGFGRAVSNFNGSVQLLGFPDEAPIVIGTERKEWNYPLNAFFHDSRLQTIYPATTIGRAGTISGLALDITTPPGQVLSNFTVRMKHASAASYTAPAWDATGWSTVLDRELTVRGVGGYFLFLDAPFEYDGSHSLMIDFSFNNAGYSFDGFCRASAYPQIQSAYFETDSAFGNPLAWSPTNAPAPFGTNLLPNLRLLVSSRVVVTPSTLGPFVNGVWTGFITVDDPIPAMRLRVTDDFEREGYGPAFAVEPGTDSDQDGLPDAWELAHFGRLDDPRGGPSDDPDLDGLINLVELRQGSDPLQPTGMIRILEVEIAAAAARVRFQSEAGVRYRLEWTDDPAAGRWQSVTNDVLATGADLEMNDPNGGTSPRRFYRVSRLKP